MAQTWILNCRHLAWATDITHYKENHICTGVPWIARLILPMGLALPEFLQRYGKSEATAPPIWRIAAGMPTTTAILCFQTSRDMLLPWGWAATRIPIVQICPYLPWEGGYMGNRKHPHQANGFGKCLTCPGIAL
jgi:hypothetical protein